MGKTLCKILKLSNKNGTTSLWFKDTHTLKRLKMPNLEGYLQHFQNVFVFIFWNFFFLICNIFDTQRTNIFHEYTCFTKEGRERQKLKQEVINIGKNALRPSSNVNHFSPTRLKTVRIPEGRSSRPPGPGTVCRVAVPSSALDPSPCAHRMAAAGASVMTRIRQKEVGQVGRRQEVPALESAPCHRFPWKPSSASTSFAGTVLGLPGRMGKWTHSDQHPDQETLGTASLHLPTCSLPVTRERERF